MIKWDMFEDQLANFFKSHRAQSEKEAAEWLSDKYDSFVKTGRDTFGNSILSSNKKILENMFFIAFIEGKRGKPINKVVEKMSLGLILYWRSATMQIVGQPPGTIKTISNNIVVPGIPITFPIRNSSDSSILAKNLILAFKLHISKVAGVNVALVPTPSGAQIPTPFPWVGIT